MFSVYDESRGCDICDLKEDREDEVEGSFWQMVKSNFLNRHNFLDRSSPPPLEK